MKNNQTKPQGAAGLVTGEDTARGGNAFRKHGWRFR